MRRRAGTEPYAGWNAAIDIGDDVGPTILVHVGDCDLLDSALAVVPRRFDETVVLALIEEYGTAARLPVPKLKKAFGVEVSNHDVGSAVPIHVGYRDRVGKPGTNRQGVGFVERSRAGVEEDRGPLASGIVHDEVGQAIAIEIADCRYPHLHLFRSNEGAFSKRRADYPVLRLPSTSVSAPATCGRSCRTTSAAFIQFTNHDRKSAPVRLFTPTVRCSVGSSSGVAMCHQPRGM